MMKFCQTLEVNVLEIFKQVFAIQNVSLPIRFLKLRELSFPKRALTNHWNGHILNTREHMIHRIVISVPWLCGVTDNRPGIVHYLISTQKNLVSV